MHFRCQLGDSCVMRRVMVVVAISATRAREWSTCPPAASAVPLAARIGRLSDLPVITIMGQQEGSCIGSYAYMEGEPAVSCMQMLRRVVSADRCVGQERPTFRVVGEGLTRAVIPLARMPCCPRTGGGM